MDATQTNLISKAEITIREAEAAYEAGLKNNDPKAYQSASDYFKAAATMLLQITKATDRIKNPTAFGKYHVLFHYSEYHYLVSQRTAYLLEYPFGQVDYLLLQKDQESIFYHLDEALRIMPMIPLFQIEPGIRYYNDFQYFRLSEQGRTFEYRAFNAIQKGDFDDALDNFREDQKRQQEIRTFIADHTI